MISPMTNDVQIEIRSRTKACRMERGIHGAETSSFTGSSERAFCNGPFCGMNAALRRRASRISATLS